MAKWAQESGPIMRRQSSMPVLIKSKEDLPGMEVIPRAANDKIQDRVAVNVPKKQLLPEAHNINGE